MKYLKRFSETLDESSINESHADDIILNVKDILLPISDMGYDISVTEDNGNLRNNALFPKIDTLIIYIVSCVKELGSDSSLNITDDLKEEFIRMKDYLQSEGYNSIIVSFLKCRSLKDKTEDEIRLIRLSGKHVESIEEKEFDDFINTNTNYPIEKLRFVATK
jgi:hypothetical protein